MRNLFVRLVAMGAVGLAGAGCANEHPAGYQGLGLRSLAIASPAQQDAPSNNAMARRVLTAIALEKVTGRKPDPGRLAETR